MDYIYNLIDSKTSNESRKNKNFLLVNSIVSALAGLLVWLLVGHFIAPGIAWLICFVLYPMFFVGFVGGTIYLFRR